MMYGRLSYVNHGNGKGETMNVVPLFCCFMPKIRTVAFDLSRALQRTAFHSPSPSQPTDFAASTTSRSAAAKPRQLVGVLVSCVCGLRPEHLGGRPVTDQPARLFNEVNNLHP